MDTRGPATMDIIYPDEVVELLYKTFDLAIRDMNAPHSWNRHAGVDGSGCARCEAHAWLRGTDSNEQLSFPWLCEFFNFDPDVVREAILKRSPTSVCTARP